MGDQDELVELSSHSSPVWGLDLDPSTNLVATSGYRWLELNDTRGARPPIRSGTHTPSPAPHTTCHRREVPAAADGELLRLRSLYQHLL